MRNSNLQQGFSAYARSLTKRFGLQLFWGNHSYTDGTKIVIRTPPANITGKDYDIGLGTVLHEAGHILFSDFDVLTKVMGLIARKRLHEISWFDGSKELSYRFSDYKDVFHSLWNAIEDPFMEMQVEKKWLGAKRIFRKADEAILSEGSIMPQGNVANYIPMLAFFVIAEMRDYQVSKEIKVAEDNLVQAFGNDVLSVLEEVKEMIRLGFPIIDSTEGSLRLAVAVMSKFDEFLHSDDDENSEEDSKDSSDSDQKDSTDDEGEGDSNGESDDSSNEPSDDDLNNDDADPDSEETSENSNSKSSSNGGEADKSQILSGTPDEGEVIDKSAYMEDLSIQIKAGEHSSYEESDLLPFTDPVQNNDTKDYFTNLDPYSQLKESGVIIASEDKEAYQELIDGLSPSAKQFQKQFMEILKSDSRSQSYASNRGKLKTSKIARVPSGETKVFTKKTITTKPKSAVSILLDLSGSMGSHHGSVLHSSLEILATMERALSKVAIRNAIYGFGDNQYHAVTRIKKFQEPSSVARRRIGGVSSNAGGLTPMHSVLHIAGEELACVNNETKTMIMITDGCPNNPEACAKAIKENEKQGIRLFVFAIDAYDMSWLNDTSAKVVKLSRSQDLGKFMIEAAANF